MKILVTFALERELAPWAARHTFDAAGNDWPRCATLDATPVCVALTGIGAQAAGTSLAALQAVQPKADVVISCGFAGALRSDLRAGDVVAARRVRLPAASPFESDARASSVRLLHLAESCGARVVPAMLTAPRVAVTQAEKRALAAFADAVEMESHTVLRAAQDWGAEAVAVRAISDEAAADLPLDFNRVHDGQGGLSRGRLALEIAKSPLRIPGLLRLGRASRLAAENLAKFLDGFISAVARSQVGAGTAQDLMKR